MKSKVFFWNLRASRKAPFDLRLRRLLKAAGATKEIGSGELVALKIHFGERGTTAFIRPLWMQPIIDLYRKQGAKPFLTDTNTLYVGQRGESVSHALQAARHGFDPNILSAPVIIADGLKSGNEREIVYPGNHFQTFYLAGDILDADRLVTVNHFKGHELAGFGGALKNLGMGCATRKGKMQQHCGLGPLIKEEHCTGCGECVSVCRPGALSLEPGGKISLDAELCAGCASCFLVCRQGGLEVNWQVEITTFLERMMEYAAAVLSHHAKPCLHLTFVVDVTPSCDCMGYSDVPICPDLGVLASFDPVAVDQAALDMVNRAVPRVDLLPHTPIGEDKFHALHGHVQGEYALEYAERLGIGSREYRLVEV
jgi:uncharacterized protein